MSDRDYTQLYVLIGAPIGLAGTVADTYASGSQSSEDSFYGSHYDCVAVFWEIDLQGLAAARNFVPVPPPVRAGVPDMLVGRRPDFVATEKQVLAAFRLQEAIKLALLPNSHSLSTPDT